MDTAIAQQESEALASASILHEWADMVIENVRSQPDNRLIELARDAQGLEKAAFRVRGACGSELKRRIRERQEQVPSARDDNGHIGKQMSALAREIGVAPKTLEDDTRIYETFSDNLRGDIRLDREHFRVALAAPDPQAAIELASEQRESNSSYSTRDFRDDVKRLQGIQTSPAGTKSRGGQVRLDDETLSVMEELRKVPELADKENSLLIKMALFEMKRTLSTSEL